jgi:hypothetical protein
VGAAEPLQEVTVTAHKLDQRRLDQVIIPRFVQAHGAPNPVSHQVGRWRSPAVICPSVDGLSPTAAQYISRRVITVAANVGAPTRVFGHCNPNIEIIFTPDPQALVSYFHKTNPTLLGYDGKSLTQRLTVSHQIQAWYSTATRFGSGWTLDSDRPLFDPTNPLVDIRSNPEALGGGSRLSVGIVSGFLNILVIADTRQVSKHSLHSIADYIAMLVLTRTSVDGCSELPSIIDLLSSDCGGRAPPDSITAADTAYLKALYAADLEKNLNVEESDMRRIMSRGLIGR